MVETGKNVTKIAVEFTYDETVDDFCDFWETKGITIKDSTTGETLVKIKPEDTTYEELIVNLLNKLGYSVDNVTNNLDDWGEINERHN